LISTIGIDFLYCIVAYLLPDIGNGFLQVVVVGRTCPFHLNVYDQVGFVFLFIRIITGLGDVHTVTLYLLTSFFPIIGIGVIVVLNAFGRDIFLGSKNGLSLDDFILFVEDTVKKVVAGSGFRKAF
jgi:hypothetical protein